MASDPGAIDGNGIHLPTSSSTWPLLLSRPTQLVRRIGHDRVCHEVPGLCGACPEPPSVEIKDLDNHEFYLEKVCVLSLIPGAEGGGDSLGSMTISQPGTPEAARSVAKKGNNSA